MRTSYKQVHARRAAPLPEICGGLSTASTVPPVSRIFVSLKSARQCSLLSTANPNYRPLSRVFPKVHLDRGVLLRTLHLHNDFMHTVSAATTGFVSFLALGA